VAVGGNALKSVTTTTANTAVGYRALEDATGEQNTAVGNSALRENTSASNNTSVGFFALASNTTGTQNVAVGANALDANTTASQNVAVGWNSLGVNTTGANNIAIGKSALSGNTTASYNVVIGTDSGTAITTSALNTLVGDQITAGSATSNKQNAFGHALTAAAGYTTIGVGFDDIRAAHGNVTWSTVSDERVKKDIEDSTVGLSFINDLRPVTFNYRNKGDLPTEFRGYEEGSTEVYKSEKSQHGFIAQEVKAAIDKHSDIKNGFALWDDDDDTGQQRVGETALIPMLTKAVQELSAKVEELESKLNGE